MFPMRLFLKQYNLFINQLNPCYIDFIYMNNKTIGHTRKTNEVLNNCIDARTTEH